jgi:ketosteroid isomerase-like protein
MSMYAPDVVAYDIVPRLQYIGKETYQKDYAQFLAQYDGPIEVEFRDVKIFVGNAVAFACCLERLNGTLKSSQKSDAWVRVTSGFQKINGKWLNIHDHVSVPAHFNSGKAMLDLRP